MEEPVHVKYGRAIAFFQKYPQEWEDLLNGLKSRRNLGYVRQRGALNKPTSSDQTLYLLGQMQRMAEVDDILRDFINPGWSAMCGEYEESASPVTQSE